MDSYSRFSNRHLTELAQVLQFIATIEPKIQVSQVFCADTQAHRCGSNVDDRDRQSSTLLILPQAQISATLLPI